MTYPTNLQYTKDHEWAEVNGQRVKVGITDFAQSELGEIVFIDLPKVGKEIKKGETFCVVESTKAASDVYSPLSGKIVEINSNLSSNSTLINSAPHAEGWMAVIEINNPNELKELLSAEAYQNFLSNR